MNTSKNSRTRSDENKRVIVASPTSAQLTQAHEEPLSQDVLDSVAEALRASLAPATWRAYRCDWEAFTDWCRAKKRCALPASVDTVVAYTAVLAKRKSMATVHRRVAAISVAHRVKGLPSPCRDEKVRRVLQGLRRRKGAKPKQKAAADLQVIRKLLAVVPADSLIALRNRALLLLGYACALRRSELVALDVADLRWRGTHLDVTVRKSKTDQESKGRLIGVVASPDASVCAVRAVRDWMKAAQLRDGPLFRRVYGPTVLPHRLRPAAVAEVVQKAAQAAGLEAKEFGGHSLRAGHVTEAVRRGTPLQNVMRTTGHRRVETLMGYAREADAVRGSSATAIW